MNTKFNRECLEAHNEYRRKHGAPPLVLSEKVKIKLFALKNDIMYDMYAILYFS